MTPMKMIKLPLQPAMWTKLKNTTLNQRPDTKEYVPYDSTYIKFKTGQHSSVLTGQDGDSFREEEGSDWGWGVSLGRYQCSVSWSWFQLHKRVPCVKVHGSVHLGFMCVVYMLFFFSIKMYLKKKNRVLSHRLVMGIKQFNRSKLLRQGMSHSECWVIPRVSALSLFFWV